MPLPRADCGPVAERLAGRNINDNMAKYVAKKVIQHIIRNSGDVKSAKVLVKGATFKENVSDIRNSKVAEVVKALFGSEDEVRLSDLKEKFYSKLDGIKSKIYAAAVEQRSEAKALLADLYARDPQRIWQVASWTPSMVAVRCIGILDDAEQSMLVVVTHREPAAMAEWVLRKCDDVPAFATVTERG